MEDELRQKLHALEQAIADDVYRIGGWQNLMGKIEILPAVEKRALSDDISRVSRALHRRNGFYELPFPLGFAVELLMFFAALMLFQVNGLLAALAGSAALTLCLQPLIKICTGLLLGVRYDYAYLWYVEPRFKMRFGSYVALTPRRKILFHLSGGMGTPVALFIAYLVITPHLSWLGLLALLGAGFALALQVGAFVAEWFGIRKVGAFRLSLLTSPATAAMELKKASLQKK